MKNERSLKKEILSLLISFSIFITIALGLISVINFYFSKLSIIEHNQKQILLQVESEANKFLNQIYNLSNYLKENYQENTTLLKNIVDTNPNISSILILDKNGFIEDFYATTNLSIYKGFDYSKQEYFSEIKENNDYWSSVFLSTVDEEPSISYSFKAENKVIVLMIKLKDLAEFISKFKNQDNTHMLKVFDKNGIVVLNPNNPDLVLQRFSEKAEKVFTELIDVVPPYTFREYFSNVLDSKQYGTYTVIEKTGWKVVIRESYDDILKSLSELILGTVIILILFIVLAVLISLKISKRIFKSFDDLQKTTTNIADGNYYISIKDSYYSEFNLLLNSFNKMKTEIDRREESLEDSLYSFKTLFNSTMEMIVIHDQGICIDANNVAIKFFKFKNKDQLIGRNLLDFVDKKYKEVVKRNYLIDTLPYEFELIINEQKYICLAQDKFIELDNHRLKLTTLIDITELKAKDRLLFQQSKMASMGEMIGNIAHQWRQPLSVISTCASGAKIEKEMNVLRDERLYESLDLIMENTQYLSKTIDDFRNFFKVDKDIEDFNINESIKKVLKLVKSSIQNHNIKVKTIFQDDLIIKGLPNEFLQVIINIINNAKDVIILNSVNERYIDIKTYKKENYCFIEISDNGGGVDESIISKVFEPYFTTKHQSQGTGIGLYMSHQIIVEHMQGTISMKNIDFQIENKSYKGCKVVIKIPLNEKTFSDYII